MFRIPFFFFNMALILLFWMKEMENTFKELYFRMVNWVPCYLVGNLELIMSSKRVEMHQ